MTEASGTAGQLSFDARFAQSLRGFGPVGIAAAIIIFAGNLIVVPVTALLVLLWAWLSRTPWHEIGYVRPKSWLGGLAIGFVFGILFKLAMKAMVMPLLGGPALNPAYHFLAGNTAALPGMLYSVVIGAGFGEETFFRGYLFERMGKLIGTSGGAKIVTVLATALFFGALHYQDQGLAGAEQALIFGTVFGTIFAITGRLWMLMCAHAAFDLTALALIYFDREAEVAHFFFP